jgi:hypothetical protein
MTSTHTVNPTPPIQVPAGVAHISEWETDEPTPRRYISAANRGVEDHDLIVWWDNTQFADGTLDIDGDPPTVRVSDLGARAGRGADRGRRRDRCCWRCPRPGTGCYPTPPLGSIVKVAAAQHRCRCSDLKG